MSASLPTRFYTRLRRLSATALYKLIGPSDNAFSPLYISGIAGSGTTLLIALLNQHYENAVYLPESALAADENSCLHIKATHEYSNLRQYQAALPFGPQVSAEQVRAHSLKLYRRSVAHPKTGQAVLDKAPNTHLARAGLFAQAFPTSTFVLIVRNPIASVEGLRRKWPLYREAPLGEVCDLWASLHADFMADSLGFTDRLTILTYDVLVAAPQPAIEHIATMAGLTPRRTLQSYADAPNQPGKGLRNVVAGEIKIDPKANEASEARLQAAEVEEIRARLWSQYEELQAKSLSFAS